MKIVPDHNQDLFNIFDNHALLVGLERRKSETNIELHNRIINRVDGNSTTEGLSDWVLDVFDVEEVYPSGIVPSGQLPEGVSIDDVKHEITNKYVFYSTNVPLTEFEYQQLRNPDAEYKYPMVYDYDDEMEYTVEYYDEGKDISPSGISASGVVPSGINTVNEWTVYKNLDMTYSRIWMANYPARKVNLNYQVLIDNEIYDIEEKPESERPE